MGRRPSEIDVSTLEGKIAKRIRHARIAAGIDTQQGLLERLAERGIDVTKATLSFWESGHHAPDVNTLYAIAAICRVKVHDLLP